MSRGWRDNFVFLKTRCVDDEICNCIIDGRLAFAGLIGWQGADGFDPVGRVGAGRD
jgi:hypothetical protein